MEYLLNQTDGLALKSLCEMSYEISVKVSDFNLAATIESGQVFGFTKNSGREYEGSLFGVSVRLKQERDLLRVATFEKSSISEAILKNYFDLNQDLTSVYQILSEDPRLAPALRAFKGLRIIRQEPWEALACFIISSNNNIKRIRGIWQNLSLAFSGTASQFPKAAEIFESKEAILRRLGLGYRAPFLLEAAKHVVRDPSFLAEIRKVDYQSAKSKLLELKGVGEKVADCVLLFGFQKYEAFPVDIWIERVMKKFYFRGRKVSERKIGEFARNRWGALSGYIQQYLYHAAKSGVL
ncbi:MAG: hypothetical protein A3C35_05335 [Omnitrophica bacterium RIFCSPHIGHO2_02_FULL_46_11]|nr:MAG: hypothetical protein A3C35_05335 [Omnitrophica bacterium RIFCSPHIGHO2_02_FULL_46_11]